MSRFWRSHNKQPFSHRRRGVELRKISKTHCILLGFCGVVGLLYIAVVNDLSTKGYELHARQQYRSQLELSANEQAIAMVKSQSHTSVLERISGLALERAGAIDYMSVPGSVALRTP